MLYALHTTEEGPYIMSKKIILLISPESASCDSLQRDLQKAGFTVYRTYTGEEGIQLGHQHIPDLIGLDITGTFALDDTLMDEWITLSELKADPILSKIPTIIMNHQDPRQSVGFLLKDIDFLKKPIDSSLFIEKINQLTPHGEVPTLLIVDDDDFSRDLLIEMTKRQGWNFLEATDGKEAIRMLKKNNPSIILLDLMMPEMSGFDVVNEMQKNEQWQHIPVIIVTAKTLSPEERTMLSQHTLNVLQKGFYSRKDLVSLIIEHVGS